MILVSYLCLVLSLYHNNHMGKAWRLEGMQEFCSLLHTLAEFSLLGEEGS